MEDEGLSGICAGLGSAEEDEDGAIIGYTTGENCLGLDSKLEDLFLIDLLLNFLQQNGFIHFIFG